MYVALMVVGGVIDVLRHVWYVHVEGCSGTPFWVLCITHLGSIGMCFRAYPPECPCGSHVLRPGRDGAPLPLTHVKDGVGSTA